MPDNVRDEKRLDDLFRQLGPRLRARDLAPALLGSSEDACLIFAGPADAPRLVATAGTERTGLTSAMTPHADAPEDVKEAIRTGTPRTLTWPPPRGDGSHAAHRSWRITEPLHPCHALIAPLDTGSKVLGAIVLLRCDPDRPPYHGDDVDTFRLIGLRITAGLEVGDEQLFS